jgi:hypothetical protein
MVDFMFDYYYEKQTHHHQVLMVKRIFLYLKNELRLLGLEVKTAMTPIGNGVEYYNPGQSSHWQPSGYT